MKKDLFKYFLIFFTFNLTACTTVLLGGIMAGTAMYGTSNNWETSEKEHQKIMNCLDKALVKRGLHFKDDEEKYKNKAAMDLYYKCIKNPNKLW
ncbi:hypothetical protein [Neisseria sp.]|uniref:hypothetical protein n=1 Tax=Neisseria sp. TaxID=192066 RepID=UPI002898F725|nr:hypothetical protein [Neisseria sp.]